MIITFYSFKGGVGRSMALANVANWLRLQNLRVAVIDWDLEAPGLENFFVETPVRRAEVQAAPGLVDLLVSYKERFPRLPAEFFAEPTREGEAKKPSLARRVELLSGALPPLSSLMVEIAPENQHVTTGRPVSLLAPGVRDKDRKYSYARDVQALSWGELYAKYDAEVLFAWMRSELDRDFDVTLIDSRTGITEVGGVCTREMADLVVTLCAANDQNLDGSALVIRSLFREELVTLRGGRKLRAALVPARYDNGETEHLLAFQKRFSKLALELKLLAKDSSWLGLDADAMWELRIPYTAKYAYQERLCVGAADANPDLLLRYEKLAQFVAKAYLDGLPAEARARLEAAGPELRKLREAEASSETLDTVLERAFAELSPSSHELARRILLRFVGFSDVLDSKGVVLQTRSLADFPAEEQAVIPELLGVRLLDRAVSRASAQSETPESGEGSRFRIPYPNAWSEWKRLADWIQADSDFLIFRFRIQSALPAYVAGGASRARLSPTVLLDGLERFDGRRQDFTERELELIDYFTKRRPLSRSPKFLAAAAAVFLVFMASAWMQKAVDPLPVPTSSVPLPTTGSTARIKSKAEIAAEFVSSARRLEAVNELDAAQRAYSSAIAANPDAKDAYVGRGSLLLRQERFDLAEQDLSRVVALDPKDPTLLLQLGQAQAGQGKLAAAVETFRRAIEALDNNPSADRKASAVAHGELAEALRSEGKFRDALTAYSEAIERRDDLWDSYYGRALTYLQLGEAAPAILDLQKVVEETPEPGLRENAVATLKSLNAPTSVPKLPAGEARRVSVQYVDADDKSLVEKLIAKLGTPQRIVPRAARTNARTVGDVRSFFASDRLAAASLKRDTEKALAELGYVIVLRQLDLSAEAFPRAFPGLLELWLPSLETYVRKPRVCYVDRVHGGARSAPRCSGAELVDFKGVSEYAKVFPDCDIIKHYDCPETDTPKAP